MCRPMESSSGDGDSFPGTGLCMFQDKLASIASVWSCRQRGSLQLGTHSCPITVAPAVFFALQLPSVWSGPHVAAQLGDTEFP